MIRPGTGPVMGQNTRQSFEQERQRLDRRAYAIDVTNVTNSNTTLLTVPDNTQFKVVAFGVCNITAGALAVTVYRVPDGGIAANTNKVYGAVSVSSNATMELPALEGQTLNPGDKIIVVTDDATTGGNFWLDGIVFSGGLPDV